LNLTKCSSSPFELRVSFKYIAQVCELWSVIFFFWLTRRSSRKSC